MEYEMRCFLFVIYRERYSYVFSVLFYFDNVIDLCSFWMLDFSIFFLCLLPLTVMINNYMKIN